MQVELLLVPFDSGRRGYRMGRGPQHLLDLGIVAALERAGHQVRVTNIEPRSSEPAEIRTAFELMSALAERVGEAVAAGRFPLVLSGNCNTAVGTVAGQGDLEPAVVWFDAHGDFNTPETTIGGFFDGMALATLTGRCWRELARQVPGYQPVAEGRVILAGARDLDPLEAQALDHSRVRRLAPTELPDGLPQALQAISGDSGVYVHVDLDVLDPSEGRVNCFATPGGISLEQARRAIMGIGETSLIRAAAFTAYDPGEDHDGRVGRAACELILSLARAKESR